MKLFEYEFELRFSEEPYSTTLHIMANNYDSAWLGMVYEISMMPEYPIKVEYIKVK